MCVLAGAYTDITATMTANAKFVNAVEVKRVELVSMLLADAESCPVGCPRWLGRY
jgi:hypothetical protein